MDIATLFVLGGIVGYGAAAVVHRFKKKGNTISGNVQAGGSVNCDDVGGDVRACGSVRYG